MYTVYAVFNQDHKKLYIGQTQDILKRLELHSQKKFKNSYTARFDGNWILIYSEVHSDRSGALVREKQLKSYRGREFLKKYIPV